MERSFKPNTKCALAGCNNTALNGIHCTYHSISQQQNGSAYRQSSSSHSPTSTFRLPRFDVIRDSRDPCGNTRPEERSRSGPFKSNLPPDLLNKHGMTARKSISSFNTSKKRTEMTSSSLGTSPSPQRGHAQSPPPPSSSSAINPATRNSQGQQSSGSFSQPQMNTDQALSGNSARNGVQPNGKAGINGQSQRRADGSGCGSEKAIPPPVNPIPHAARTSQPPVTNNGVTNGVSTVRDSPGQPAIRHQKSNSKEKANAVASSASPSGERSFRSLPYVRTNFQPPVHVKSVPTVPSASKRKRDNSPDSSLTSSSGESDEDEAIWPHRPSSTVTAAPIRTGVSRLLYQGMAASPITDLETGTRPAAIQNGLVNNHIHTHVLNSQDQSHGVSDRNGPSAFASHSPFLTSGLNGLEGVHGDPDGEAEEEETGPLTESQNHHRTHAALDNIAAAKTQRLLTGTDPRRSRPLNGRKKMTNEERRLQLCASFDSAKFDAMLYGQDGAASPPRDVFIPAAPTYPQSAPAPGENRRRNPLYMRNDPRIHWPHNRSEQWYERKMEEISARGGRKENFGKAAQRMRDQRLAEERRATARAAEEAAAARQGRLLPAYNPTEPWSHHRPMDFGDVPEEELPNYVRKNPEWVKAAKWMRQNREDSMRRNEDAAELQAADKPWEHLFPKTGR